MALVPTITPQEVADIGALTPALFQVADTTAMNLLIQSALDYADGWFQGHSGLNYGLATPAWVPVLQRRGVMYLALEALTDMLKARKIYGTQYAYDSEESASYEALIDNEWGQKAREALDLWLTVETQGAGFALPYFGITEPVPLVEDGTNGLDSLIVLYEEILARARGFSNLDTGSIQR